MQVNAILHLLAARLQNENAHRMRHEHRRTDVNDKTRPESHENKFDLFFIKKKLKTIYQL